MPRLIPALVIALLLSSISIAHARDSSEASGEVATPPRWESAKAAYSALEQFNGKWRGVGDGKWGTSSSEKYFAPILDGKAMCRGGSSVYPVQDRNPKGELHKAHSLIALAKRGGELTLTEYDNEGLIARYVLDLTSSEANESWIFELVSGENLPPKFRARLTLHVPRNDHYVETFELDFGGKGYVTYLTNRLARVSEVLSDRGCHVE